MSSPITLSGLLSDPCSLYALQLSSGQQLQGIRNHSHLGSGIELKWELFSIHSNGNNPCGCSLIRFVGDCREVGGIVHSVGLHKLFVIRFCAALSTVMPLLLEVMTHWLGRPDEDWVFSRIESTLPLQKVSPFGAGHESFCSDLCSMV